MEQGEVVIWKEDNTSPFVGIPVLFILSFGVAVIVMAVIGFIVGIIQFSIQLIGAAAVILIIGLLLFLLGLRLLKRVRREYVVTNLRAMQLRGDKVVKEVSLSTPGLVASLVNPSYRLYEYYGGVTRGHVTYDVVFLVNGIELLRFDNTRRGGELVAKLESMGIKVIRS